MPTNSASYTPAHHQNYVTKAGQSIPVYYDIAGSQKIYAQVYIDGKQPIQNGYLDLLNQQVQTLNGTYNIGQRVSAESVALVLNGFGPATVLGVLVSTASGSGFAQYCDPSAINIPYFPASGVSVVVVS
jgi:hypothetical protein